MKAALVGLLLLSFQIPTPRFNACTPTFMPSDWDFGTVPVGCMSAPRTFQLKATCAAAMALSKPLNAQFVIRDVGSDHFTVQFVPSQYGAAESLIMTEVNHVPYFVSFRGNGDSPPAGYDVFAEIGTRRVFFLTGAPVPGTVSVTGTADAWTYDAQTNAVVFASPPHGTFLDVTYRVACP